MAVVMQLLGDAHGRPTGYDGQYLVDFDFEDNNGEGLIDLSPDITKAKRFANMGEAMKFHQTVPLCRPLRRDGRPNKPLTATNWNVFDPDIRPPKAG